MIQNCSETIAKSENNKKLKKDGIPGVGGMFIQFKPHTFQFYARIFVTNMVTQGSRHF